MGLYNISTAFLQRGKIAPHQVCPGYGIKKSDSKAPALYIWGILSTPTLPLLPNPRWVGVVATDRVLFMG